MSRDEICGVCNEPRSAHVATAKGPFTHPREARGEGYYCVKSRGTIGGGLDGDDYDYVTYEFVSTVKEQERLPN